MDYIRQRLSRKYVMSRKTRGGGGGGGGGRGGRGKGGEDRVTQRGVDPTAPTPPGGPWTRKTNTKAEAETRVVKAVVLVGM